MNRTWSPHASAPARLPPCWAFDAQQQTRLATTISEIARNAVQYGGGGRVDFSLEGQTAPQLLVIRIADQGKGIADLSRILDGEYASKTGIGMGIVGARRLMDRFDIQSSPNGGTCVSMWKLLPRKAQLVTARTLPEITAELIRHGPSRSDGGASAAEQRLAAYARGTAAAP